MSVKLKTYSVKENVKMKRQATEQEKTFSEDTSDKGLLSKHAKTS